MSGVRSLLRTILRLALVVSGLALACRAGAVDESALRAALERLAGQWTGEAQVKAMDGFVLKTVRAERRVTWEQDALVVETILRDGTAEYAIVARHAIRLGRLESAVTRPSQPEDRYLGELNAGALVWTNAEGNRRDARESIAERGGELLLETTSVEPIRALGLSGLVRIEARYRRPAPTRDSPLAAAAAGSDLAQIQAQLEQERLALATWRARAEEAESRLAALASRTEAPDPAGAELVQVRAQLAELDAERRRTGEALLAAQARLAELEDAARAREQERHAADARIAGLQDEMSRALAGRDELQARLATAEGTRDQAQRDNERLSAANAELERGQRERDRRVQELEERLASAQAAPAPVVAVPPETGGAADAAAFGPRSRDDLMAEVEQLERRVLALEAERNSAREQTAIAQRQVEEARRLRDETLARFQGVVTELNAIREEKERLARANVSLQAEVRAAQQQSARSAGALAAEAVRPATGAVSAPATTLDGKTADMVIAGLQIIGVTRGEDEDKAILDGRVFRNGDLVEAQLGIVFLRIEGNALVFQDRRGREYRRRF